MEKICITRVRMITIFLITQTLLGFQFKVYLIASCLPENRYSGMIRDSISSDHSPDDGLLKRERSRITQEGMPFIEQLLGIAEWENINSISGQVPSGLIDIHFIKENLKPDELLLEYYISDSMLYIFSLSKYSSFLYRGYLNLQVRPMLEKFRKHLKSAEMDGLAPLCQEMYALLILPVYHLLLGTRRLIIIPGKELSGLPFEAFIRTDDNQTESAFCNRRFLIYDYEITYHYSAMQWAAQQQFVINSGRVGAGQDQKYDFMGFSPVFCENPKVNPLPESAKELILIGDLFQQQGLSSWIVYEQASRKEVFRSLAGTSRILHLATHIAPGFEHNDGAAFLFWDYNPCERQGEEGKGMLTMKEIGGMRLENELIVLNACASGSFRKYSSGKMASFALSFMLAGGRNILSTLWNISDSQAFTFIVDFYRHLLSGKTYSQALRAVKIKMIQRKETSLPTLWAAYVLMGE